MIPGLLANALLGAFLGDDHYRGEGRDRFTFGSQPRRPRRGGFFSTEEDRFKDFLGSQGGAPPSAQGEIDADTASLMAPAAGPATIDFPEKGSRREPPVVPPPLPDDAAAEADDDWFLEVPEREVAKTFAGKALLAMIGAAHADGTLSGPERTMIEERLSSLPPAERAFVERELNAPRDMAEYADKNDPADERKTLFALAVAVLKADGKANPDENRFAGKLATALGLTKDEAMAIIRRVSINNQTGDDHV